MSRLYGRLGHPPELANSHAFLHERVTLYSKTLFGFLALLTAIGLLKLSVLPEVTPLAPRSSVAWMVALLAGLTLGIGLDWLYLRGRRRPVWLLHLYESVGTLILSGTFCLITPLLPPGPGSLFLAFLVILVLVVRAALVPSRAVVTLVVGVLSSALVGGALLRTRAVGTSPGEVLDSLMWLVAIAWCLIFTLVTAVISQVIYGLHRRVREALELGQYTLERKLGEGGMGTVYLARHALLRRPTAVKVLDPERAGEASMKRFEREVTETSRLRHPNTIDIYDYGHTADGVFYYAMEYLDGLDLERFVKRFGALPAGRALYLVAQVAHALAEAHDAGLIHRDVKPANIVVCNQGGVPDVAKVLDFGLVKNLGAPADPTLSTAATFAGTPLYMSPESIANPQGLDGRSDLYSLGCVLWFLLTGNAPFTGTTLVDVCARHLHEAPPSLCERTGQTFSSELENIVARCLAKDPRDRFETALEAWRALRRCPEAKSWSADDAIEWWQTHTVVSQSHSPEQSLPRVPA